MTAEAMVMPGLAKNPAKNRQTTMDARLVDNPVPRLNNIIAGMHTAYTPIRPRFSLRVDVIIDPMARPRLYIENGSTIMVAEARKSCCNLSRAGAITEAAKVLWVERLESAPMNGDLNESIELSRQLTTGRPALPP